MICPNCKKELITPGRFCGYCGAPLEETAEEEKTTIDTQIDHSQIVLQNQSLKKRKKEKSQKKKTNMVDHLIPIVASIAVLAVIVVVVLAARLVLVGKDHDWIANLTELESVQTVDSNGMRNTYQLEREFERMSVKATIPSLNDEVVSDNQKLLQVWIDDSLVYEIEAGQSEKEEWTFAIDLRNVDTMTIFTADSVRLKDVQMIRQSSQKTGAETVK